MTDRAEWEHGLADELGWWRWRLGVKDETLAARLDPDSVITEDFAQLLSHPPATIRLLDVGAGPLTSVAKRWPGHELVITAVDALAQRYDEVLEELDIVPPVRTRQGESEHLQDMFAEGTFDIVHASNSLDHTYDPMQAIRQMIALTAPGGVVVLRHFPEEAERQKYHGLHQWNFFLRGDDAEVWGLDGSYLLQEELAPLRTTAGLVADQESGRMMVQVVITKEEP